MREPGVDPRLEAENRTLRTQNRRFRELIQSLSSMMGVLRKRLEVLESRPRALRAFEAFAPVEVPEASLPSGGFRFDRGASQASLGSDHAREGLPRPLTPSPGWKCLAKDLPHMRIGFMLFGMTPEQVEETVGLVEHRQVRNRDFTPVFLTDVTDLEPFRARGYVVEYIPRPIARNPENRQAERRYLSERIHLIRAKWNLHKLVDVARSGP